mmetsp:Transcript_31898/g.49937  ORF Transcript_31898/g.49937 Transcript_31898/m.49937 type:complete len:561 (-) Transcript_31898:96-1778(-)|eukprot:CAMPEP_0201518750 /NCGR_PEP_ID=MMETSP0161_2-20130828/9501_1 /ASSEMBLY_ACC=CAM_ASM_000251 /TAXON_ID=180227 /ORGANISM="Neoparamoeba aestuarina, Strain SoJaBio B1-5/56/2" /LENGTH=560 /DNA_ID=CAMNT_0047916607 /DNA_START=47 /DNA_END=1729 /DNA_ORIENTATION=+
MASGLVDRSAWAALQLHLEEMKKEHMRDMFEKDDKRFDKFSLEFCNDLFLDYSKNIINEKTVELLLKLAEESGLEEMKGKMFSGKKINFTEDRAVLHIALRNMSDRSIEVDGEDVMPKVKKVLEKMTSFSDALHKGEKKGCTGKIFTDVVNIGIGGSDLGPRMVCEALKKYGREVENPITPHFISNVDGTDASEVVRKLNPETTLFVIASKTFTTQETMTNASSVREWFKEKVAKLEGVDPATAVSQHFVALSTNKAGVEQFGIDTANMFEFWDWVGGRYSLWSAIGLPIAIALGSKNFLEFMEGGHELDEHFRTAPAAQNAPVILALLGIWYNNFFGLKTHAILPYEQYLHRFAAHFQQVDMESNGKSVDKEGNRIEGYSTGPVIWGEPGTNGQHAFYQLIHQGTQVIPADLMAGVESLNNDLSNDHHTILLSNYFAQSEALMKGKTAEEVKTELEAAGMTGDALTNLIPHKVFVGNKPTNSILYPKLTPRALGILIALYEHKVFVQGAIWGINSFDQWGVELGKQLAKAILKDLAAEGEVTTHDCSTNGLINRFKSKK